ncbi:hypothetical protein M758_5G159800 [Ceratodon purpureus]|nr:hypothetical protein M758_5G159800 [Ceratodon purpureus]
MFTDGLDTSALQWVTKGDGRTGSNTPRTCSTPASVRGSPDITRYDYQPKAVAHTPTSKSGKTWGLPPLQLSSVHLHSPVLQRPPFESRNELDESVGSISGGNTNHRGYEDDDESGDEQESGLYSPSTSSSPSRDAARRVMRPVVVSDNVEVGDYYDGPLSRKNSFGKKGGRLSRDGSGRKDAGSSGRREEHEGTLSRKNSFDMRRDAHGIGARKENFDKENAVNSYDMRDLRQGAYTGSGRFDPYYNAYNSGANGVRGNSRTAQLNGDDELMSSATELSIDTGDESSSAEEKSVEDHVLGHRSAVKPPQRAGYPQIDGYQPPLEREYRPAQRVEAQSPAAVDRRAATPTNSTQDHHKATVGQQPTVTGGPPSAPPFEQEILEAPAGSSIAGSYVTGPEQHSTSTVPREPSVRSTSTMEEPGVSSHHHRGPPAPPSRPAQPTPPLYSSGQAAWQALVAYDACVRLCLKAWARGCMEAPEFLLDECSLLRNCFGLQQLLLQPHEEGARKGVSEEIGDASAPMQKRSVGKVKVQVRKLKMMSKPIPLRSSSLSAIDTNTVASDFEVRGASSHKKSAISNGWSTAVRQIRKSLKPAATRNSNSSQRSIAYVNAGAHYVRQVSGMLKDKVNSLRHSSLTEVAQENFMCVLRLKSSLEQDVLRLQPGAGETTTLLPENAGDDLLLDVQDMKGNLQGRLTLHVASISDDPSDRVRWYNLYSGPEHELVGKVQLFLSYTITSGEVDSAKWGPVGETRAYDIVLEVAMRVQQFQRRNLRLEGTWLWLLSEFASYYGVSVSYTKLRYLVCIMEMATPTEDCLVLIHDLLCPIIKARDENALNRQEKRILVDVQEQVEQLLAVVFENYKSLDEDAASGLADSSTPAAGTVAPALVPAVQIYTLLHDILSVESQNSLRNFFKTAAMKRWKRLVAETDEFVSNGSEGFLMDPLSMSSAYQKMRNLCLNVRSEVRADIEIHDTHVLPSCIDLPSIAASIYDVELAKRLRTFLVACPPSSPSPPVAELMLATADFQQDLVAWRIRKYNGGIDAKDLFHLYIVLWIQDKRLHLLDFCKFDKERCTWVTTQHTTSPFVEEVYERIKETLNEYEVIISRWPEYTVVLESALADVERAVIGALEKQYAEMLLPLKDVMIPKKFSLQYMQKLTRRQKLTIYSVPTQLGVMLNSLKRLLDTLRPRMEAQMKAWVACLPEDSGGAGRAVFGERLNEVTIELRAKYKNYLQSIVEKLADNARLQRTTKLKKILQDTREAGGESDIRERMQPLNTQLVDTISHLHDVFTTRVFVAVCRGLWDRMARDVLHFLENRKGNRSWYKGSSFALGILDDVFATQMQRLQGRALQEKDLDPPRSVAEARSMLSRDAQNGTDSSSLFFY